MSSAFARHSNSHSTLLAAFILLAAIVAASLPASAQDKKVALVIGNANYEAAPKLRNTVNDAADLSQKLRTLGFEVIEGMDLSKRATDQSIQRFSAALENASLGVFFYAGHGLQVDGVNYLVPIDAQVKSPAGLDFELVRLDLVQKNMELEARANIIFLDACRDNPFTRNLSATRRTRSLNVGRGLATVEAGRGTLISFSTQPGNVALDGDGRNSPFTSALLRHIGQPGEELLSAMIRVRQDVFRVTNGKQVPWDQQALFEQIVLVPDATRSKAGETSPPVAASTSAPPAPGYQDDLRALVEEMRKKRTDEAAKSQEVPAATTAPVPTAERNKELAEVWPSVSQSNSIAVLELFIVRSSGTIYSDLARARLDELRSRSVQAPATVAPAASVAPATAPPVSEAATVAPSGTVAPAAAPTSCDSLWRQRNAIFHEFGYCFDSARGVSLFGNDNCFRNQNETWRAMGESNRQRIRSIKELERVNGC